MKKLLILSTLALALASCAPTVQQSTPIVRTQTYASSCATVMAEFLNAGPALRPSSVGAPAWSAYIPEGGYLPDATTAAGFNAYSDSLISHDRVVVRVTCTEAGGKATVQMASTGQNAQATKVSQEAWFNAVKVP